SIEGKVTDENGMPLTGVTILVENTTKGTFTDFDGNYSISAKNGDYLVFSSIGFETQRVLVGDETQINIQMVSDVASLTEVILTGYNTIIEKKSTGAISTVKTKD